MIRSRIHVHLIRLAAAHGCQSHSQPTNRANWSNLARVVWVDVGSCTRSSGWSRRLSLQTPFETNSRSWSGICKEKGCGYVFSQGCKKCGSPRTCFVTKISAAFRSRTQRGTVCARSISSRGDLDRFLSRKLPILRARFTWPELFPWPNSVQSGEGRETWNFQSFNQDEDEISFHGRKDEAFSSSSPFPFFWSFVFTRAKFSSDIPTSIYLFRYIRTNNKNFHCNFDLS